VSLGKDSVLRAVGQLPPRSSGGFFDDDRVGGSLALVNRAKRTTRRGDIESELYCSAWEARAGCLPSLGSEFGKAAVVVCRVCYSPDDGTKTDALSAEGSQDARGCEPARCLHTGAVPRWPPAAPAGSACTSVAEMHSLEPRGIEKRPSKTALVAGAGTSSAAIISILSTPVARSVPGESRSFRVDES